MTTRRCASPSGRGERVLGIQQADWDDAPALSDKNRSVVIKGRQYDLYYSGSRLHMIALRAGGASYWVVNTLLDTLSNETMLEIAKAYGPCTSKFGCVKTPLGIFGAGWVGLVTGACFAERGHTVVVRDVVAERIESLNAGQLPFHEPGLAELLERNRERLTFTLDVEDLKG